MPGAACCSAISSRACRSGFQSTAYRRPLLGTGVCGALTTFSTFQIELLKMLEHGDVGLAIAYAAGSLGAGLLGVALGTGIVRRARLTW